MNKDISGILALVFFSSPVIGLVIIIFYKIFWRKKPTNETLVLSSKRNNKKVEDREPLSPVRLRLLFVAAILWSLMGGAAAGLISAILGAFFYTAFLFPFVMGLGGGGAMTGAVEIARIKSKVPILFLSLLSALALYVMYLYGSYIVLQVQTSFAVSPDRSQATSDGNLHYAHKVLDSTLYEKTGHSGLMGYILYKIQQGVPLGRFYHNDRPYLNPRLSVIYWVLEFGIILWVIQFMGTIKAKTQSLP